MRARWYVAVAVAGLGVLGLSMATEAHHAFSAEFDANKPVVLRGTITKVEWINPHIWVHLQVAEPDGTLADWAVEGGAPNAMFRRGWNLESVPPGIEIVVEGYRAKNGENKANGRTIQLPDGRRLFVGSSGTGAPREGAAEQGRGSRGSKGARERSL